MAVSCASGRTTSHAEVAASTDVRGWIPALAVLAEHIGDAQVRPRHDRRLGRQQRLSAHYPAAIVGLNATVHTQQTHHRRRRLLHRHVRYRAQRWRDDHRSAASRSRTRRRCGKFPNPASRYAIVGVMVAQTGGGVRVAVTGAGPCVFRLPDFHRRSRRISRRARWTILKPAVQSQQRHPRQRRIPGASGQGNGQARDRRGELKGALRTSRNPSKHSRAAQAPRRESLPSSFALPRRSVPTGQKRIVRTEIDPALTWPRSRARLRVMA